MKTEQFEALQAQLLATIEALEAQLSLETDSATAALLDSASDSAADALVSLQLAQQKQAALKTTAKKN
jgi:hypothetical protein